VECNGKNIESKRVPGQAEQPTSVARRPHFGPKNSWVFFPKFLYKPLNSLLPLILEIWKENFEKEILEKGNPNLGTTTLFRSRNLWM
jgi:hypothetical protein